ncbi:hypothetical protein [Mesorhizobium sp. WSM2239]|uniref:Uncharacterized protein n=2 Tax=unclassified Mesorhizobium TaxID=325217 RepID=A0AAU8DC70_9HYPH
MLIVHFALGAPEGQRCHGDRNHDRQKQRKSGNRRGRKLLAAGFRPLSIREEGTLHPARLRHDAHRRIAEPDFERKSNIRRLNARRSRGSSCVHIQERCPLRIIPGSKTLETAISASQITDVAAENGAAGPCKMPLKDLHRAKTQTVLLNRRTDHASR